MKCRCLDGENSRQADTRITEAIGEAQIARNMGLQFASRRSPCHDDDLGTLIQTAAGIVQRVHCSTGLKMEIALPVNTFQQTPQEGCDVVNVQSGVIFLGEHQQIFGERQLPLAQYRVGLGQ